MFDKLSREEYEKLYDEILFRLTAAFPNGTVEFKTSNKASAYIPSHAIQHKIRNAAGPYWSWHVTTEKPIYHEDTDEIEVRGVLSILNSSAEGQGFATLDRNKDTRKIRFYKESIRAAASDALRDAADKYGVGHIDLAPYREWAKNPGAGLIDINQAPQTEKRLVEAEKKIKVIYCKNCGVVLSQDDLDYLKLVRWTINVCKEHVPEHQKKKNDPNYREKEG